MEAKLLIQLVNLTWTSALPKARITTVDIVPSIVFFNTMDLNVVRLGGICFSCEVWISLDGETRISFDGETQICFDGETRISFDGVLKPRKEWTG